MNTKICQFQVLQGNEGACICKTNQAVLIGLYGLSRLLRLNFFINFMKIFRGYNPLHVTGENQQAGQCNIVVEKLGDYLKESNY